MTALVVVAAVFFLFGLGCMCAGAIYYSRAKIVHANADALTVELRSICADTEGNQQRGEDVLARIQEHSVL